MIVPGILIFFFGLFMLLDVRGCVIADRAASAVAKAKSEELTIMIMETMPSEWKTVYSGMQSSGYYSEKWNILKNYLLDKPENTKMPFLSSDQIRIFLDPLENSKKDDAFALIAKCMEKEK